MLIVIGSIIPIALAVALSTVPVLATLALLLSPRRAESAPLFLVGWFLGLFGVAAIFAVGLAQLPKDLSGTSGTVIGVLEIIVGAVMLVIGIRAFRIEPPTPGRTSAWLGRVQRMGRWPAFVTAIVLNVRPKALVLAAATGLVVGSNYQGLAEAVIELLIYTAISASTIAVPVILTLQRPATMEPRIRATRDWMTRNQSIITAIVLLLIGAGILGNGLIRLGS